MNVMKKLTVLLFAMVVAVFNLYGQQDNNSRLWKISGNGLEEASYLYGTFHLLCPDDLNIQQKVTNAMDASDQLVLELDFDDPSVMTKIQQSMAFTDGTTAEDYLDESDYKLLSDFFRDSLNMPFERLKSIKPFFLSSMTLMHFLGCQPVSFEQRLTKMAGERNMEVKGLETVGEQLGFIDNLPMEYKKKMLMENLKEYDKSKKMFDRMVGFYREGNLDGINNLSEDYMSEDYARFKDELLVKRNHRWIPDVTRMIGKSPSFIAVGASHLPGDKGLIHLLRQEGYQVDPVH
jgi:hypothetical protein